jgi:cytochrome d ubiquinol oxidase subunit I
MVSGFGVASVYAWGWLRCRRDRYHRLGFVIPFVVAAAITPVQIGVGDWAARFLAQNQPIKLAALEGVFETGPGVPLTLGGWVVDGEVRYGIEIPNGLSLLAYRDPDAVVAGLDAVPEEDRPPVQIVRLSFQLMVAIGFFLLGLGAWMAAARWRRGDLPASRWFWRGAVAAGPAAAIALEAGWVVTEVGRQPWIVYQLMRVDEAVTAAPGVTYGYWLLAAVYTALTVATVFVLRRLPRGGA